jgi:hypothetical protein
MKMTEHVVWEIIKKDVYTEEGVKKIEDVYDELYEIFYKPLNHTPRENVQNYLASFSEFYSEVYSIMRYFSMQND